MYYRGSGAAIVVYDITSEVSIATGVLREVRREWGLCVHQFKRSHTPLSFDATKSNLSERCSLG